MYFSKVLISVDMSFSLLKIESIFNESFLVNRKISNIILLDGNFRIFYYKRKLI